MSGPSQNTREVVLARAKWYCELCGGTLNSGMSIHHRKPRQMGGTKNPYINDPVNLLAICGSGTTGCHGWVETHRTDGYECGWLVRTGFNPEEIPIRDFNGNWFLLQDDQKLPLTFLFETPNPSSPYTPR